MLTIAEARPEDVIPIIAVSVGGFIAILAVVGGIIRSVFVNRSREQSRREIAAYVAEGSMTADEGERLLKAGTLGGCGMSRTRA